jgi:predicted nucleotidyltransferase
VDGEHALDLLGHLEPIGAYDDLVTGCEVMQVAGRSVRVIGLDDLIRIKRHLGRPKDRESLLQLDAIRQLREQEGLR